VAEELAPEERLTDELPELRLEETLPELRLADELPAEERLEEELPELRLEELLEVERVELPPVERLWATISGAVSMDKARTREAAHVINLLIASQIFKLTI